VRPRGGDFRCGAPVLREGQRVETRHLLALAALGIARVPVRLRPRVAVVSTGKELVDHSVKPGPGQVRNATAPYLVAELERLGCQIVSASGVGDDPAAFRARVESLLDDDLDLIVATGGVSMGKHDYVPGELAGMGAEVLFHKTATRPGKPVLAARLGHGPLFLGLPGNPVSTTVALRFFVVPVLRFWLAMPDEEPVRARLSEAVGKPEGLRCFFKAKLELRPDGVRARCLPGQASYQIQPLLDADGWAVLPEDATSLPAGAEVEVYPL
jgi:molybdopterin molybdotransferase